MKNMFRKLFLPCLMVLSISSAKAGVEPVLRNTISGSSLRIDSTRTVEDAEYAASNLGDYNLYKALNYVSLEVNQDQIANCYQDSIYLSVDVEIIGWDENGSQTTDTAELSVVYNQNLAKTYKAIHTKKLEGFYKLQINILDVSDNNLTQYFLVSAEIAIERYKTLDVGTTPTISSSSYNSTTGDITVSWGSITGAEEYDLEYTWVDDYDGDGGYISASSLEANFKNNATRVTVEGNSYSFSNVFEHGYVVFRVRAAGLTGSTFSHRIQGPWSDDANTASLSDYSSGQKLAVTELNSSLNWQYVNTFSEHGKRKELISYMDGSFRSRQSITKISSDTTLIVGESIYDYHGRAALQILPVPVDAQKLEYQADFNLDSATEDNISAIHFDTGTCDLTLLPLDTSTGASKYYSPSNEFLTQSDHWLNDHNPYIPDAYGYPMTRTIFTNDNSGRVVAQSGVGRDHQIGSGHETKYFYGSPFQEELDRLFGNNIGSHRHYQKQMTIDPNGQVSVSYTDLSGKEVATSLAGASPENVDSLANNDGKREIEVELVSDKSYKDNAYSSTVSKTINVAVPATYRLSYILEQASFTDECMNDCYECVYDLELSIKDDCGQELMDGDNDTVGIQKFFRQVKRVDSSYFAHSCPSGSVYYKFIDDPQLEDSIRVTLGVGSYTISKTLTVSDEAAQYYADEYIQDTNCVKTEDDFKDYYIGLIDDFGCNTTCEECTEMLSDSAAYISAQRAAYVTLGYSDDAELTKMVEFEYQAKKEACQGICNQTFSPCDYKRGIIQADVAPGGQYDYLLEDETQHPEYCIYEFCTNNEQAYRFENYMRSQEGSDQTILDGWMNPLKDNPDYPTGAYDTFFYSNSGYKENLQARMLNVATLELDGSHELNIYEVVTYATYCQEETTWSGVSGCLDNFEYNSQKCAPKSGYAIELFKAMYLKVRKDALDSIERANCSISIPSGKTRRFITNSEIEDEFPDNHTARENEKDTRCENFCDSVSFGWMQALGECVTGHPDVDLIRASLVNVCRKGCDGNNPMGAKQVTPANISGTMPNSFREVLDSFGIYDPATCNPEVIGFPGDWQGLDGDTAQVVEGNYDCKCEVFGDSCLITFSDPDMVAVMQRINYEEEEEVCTECLSCEQFYPYYEAFFNEYGNVPFDGDSSQTRWPSIFTNFLNDTLGYDLFYQDYVDFVEKCVGLTDSGYYFEDVLDQYRTIYEFVGDLEASNYQGFEPQPKTRYNLYGQPWAPLDYYGNESLLASTSGAPFQIQTAVSPPATVDRCVCANLLYTNEMFQQVPYGDDDTSDVSRWDSVYSGCGINNITHIETLKKECRKAFANHVSPNQVSQAQYACWWNDAAEEQLSWMVYEKSYSFYNFVLAIDQSCVKNTRSCNDCVSDSSDYDPPSWRDSIPDEVIPFPCEKLRSSIDSVMDERGWTNLTPHDSTWWFIAQRVDTIFAEEPYYRMGGFQDVEFRKKRIKAEISRCIIQDPCYRVDYFDPCQGEETVREPNNKPRTIRNFFDDVVGPRDNGGYYNFLQVDGWNLDENEIGVLTFANTPLYTGSNPTSITYNLVDPGVITLGGAPLVVSIEDGAGFDVEFTLSFLDMQRGNFYHDIKKIIDIQPIVGHPCDDSTYSFNFLAVLATEYGDDTTWMMGESDMYNLLADPDEARLCNRQQLIPEDTCIFNLTAIAEALASRSHSIYLDSIRTNFIHRYKTHCIDEALGGNEEFTMRFDQQEYHYTLYYYDLAGNLTQTVPPAGVNILNATQLQQVEDHRQQGTGNGTYNSHDLPTYYHYNTLNELKFQATPDGGVSDFWYDRLGRMVVSRNAKQKAYSDPTFSYTLYDDLGRIEEVGQIKQDLAADTMTFSMAFNNTLLANWMAAGTRSQITNTYYDHVAFSVNYNGFGQEYLRNRVSSTTYSALEGGGYQHAVHYDYDVHGNVETMVRELVGLDSINQRYKIIDYRYELVSGNVLEVLYQQDSMDRFFHKYEYDADNRITKAFTSRDHIHWDRDAQYTYYLHGPMARTELGQLRVQGMDYAYTIHGWIKGVNSERLRTSHDIGKDGNIGGNNQWVCRDVFGYGLGYYNGDYSTVGNVSSSTNFIINKSSSSYQSAASSLYNGNISYMVTAIGKFMEQGDVPFGRAFTYDQLNRIKSSRAFNNVDTTNNQWSSTGAALTAYGTDYTYDPNGNILTLDRKGHASTTAMDDITYHYYSGTNRLEYVDDAVSSSNYGVDIDDQSSGNYTYDEIGNLISDASEEIDNISWTVYGKIESIQRTSGSTKPDLQFEYSPDGYRVAKHVIDNSTGLTTSTWYVRDASGNIMATYSKSIYMELDTSNLFVDSLIMMVKSTETTNTYVDFLIEGLDLPTYMTTTKYEDLRDLLNLNSTLQSALESVSAMTILNYDLTWASQVMDNVSDNDLHNALLNYFGDEVVYASNVFGNNCYTATYRDIFAMNYQPVAEYILSTMPWIDKQNYYQTYFPGTPYPGDFQAAFDLQGTGNFPAIYDELEAYSYGNFFYYVQLSTGFGTLESYMSTSGAMKGCARLELGDLMCLNAIDNYSPSTLWTELQNIYSLTDIADAMILYSPEIFLRAGLLQEPDYGLDLLETGNYVLIPPSTYYPTYVVSINDFFEAVENYSPLGPVYLQNLKNSLMNNGHVAPGWIYSVSEHHIYGSSRIGVHQTQFQLATRSSSGSTVYSTEETEYTSMYRGKRNYELSNHLGNVQVVISDKRVSICDEYLAVDYFEAEVLSAVDYYPFGMTMPDRQWYANSDSSGYRFGFNGQEKDDEVAGVGNSMTAEFWQYDSRLGRRFNVDPIMKFHESPYSCYSNCPLFLIDIDGADTSNSIENIVEEVEEVLQLMENHSTTEQTENQPDHIQQSGCNCRQMYVSDRQGSITSTKIISEVMTSRGSGDELTWIDYEIDVIPVQIETVTETVITTTYIVDPSTRTMTQKSIITKTVVTIPINGTGKSTIQRTVSETSQEFQLSSTDLSGNQVFGAFAVSPIPKLGTMKKSSPKNVKVTERDLSDSQKRRVAGMRVWNRRLRDDAWKKILKQVISRKTSRNR